MKGFKKLTGSSLVVVDLLTTSFVDFYSNYGSCDLSTHIKDFDQQIDLGVNIDF